MEVFMSGIVLTAYPGSILGPVAKFLGWIKYCYSNNYNLYVFAASYN